MLTFLKIGGSLITDKAHSETIRPEVIRQLALEISEWVKGGQGKLLIGHGSGSFGHIAASQHGTRQGVQTPEQWHGFAEVSLVASRLTNIVLEAFQQASIPVMRFQPSASTIAENGIIKEMAHKTINSALTNGLVPLIHGDVAFDTARGGTIISTEEIFFHLVEPLAPERILLAGDYTGVFDQRGKVIKLISSANFSDIKEALGGSESTDVTGGMASKVESMLMLCQQHPHLTVHIFSGRETGHVKTMLSDPQAALGTTITA